MKVTFYGHACFSAEVSGKHLLFDPFITPNELARHIDASQLKADYILISHGHEDHVADAPAIAKRTGAAIVSNYEIAVWFNKKHGVEKYHPMNHGGSWKFNFGTVKYVSAVHSSTLPDGTPGGNPGGFVVTSTDGNFYYSGDTALTYDMKLIGESTSLNFCLLPIGDNFTMGIDDAVRAAQFVNCKNIIGLHYDTFGYIKIDQELARKKFTDAGLTLHLPQPGQTINL